MNCHFSEEPIIRLGHVEVRLPREADVESLSKHSSDPKVWNQLGDAMPHPNTPQHVRDWMNEGRSSSAFMPSGDSLEDSTAVKVPTRFAIVVNGEACGAIDFRFGTGFRRLNATIGYWLGSAYARQGIMSAVVPAFVEWGRKTFGWLIRMRGTAYEFNKGSIAVMKKAGFAVEGIAVNSTVKLGVIHNDVWLAALRPGVEAFKVE